MTFRRSVALLPLAALFAAAPAFAQDGPSYPTPLEQTTQGTYVPQSVAMSGPEEIDENTDDRAAPPGYTVVLRPRKHLIVAGAVTFGVTYTISLLTAAIGEDTKGDGDNEVAAMAIPVAGPFIQMGQTDSATARVFLVGLGGAQLAGAIMLYYGVTTKQRVFVRNDLVGSLSVGPMTGEGTTGMLVSGRF